MIYRIAVDQAIVSQRETKRENDDRGFGRGQRRHRSVSDFRQRALQAGIGAIAFSKLGCHKLTCLHEGCEIQK
ncbi:MAG TPA: hypothetical protein VM659_25590 [Dongiaceae bacterium]|nr:hypothetical protein [Dongiaceae bacterium]